MIDILRIPDDCRIFCEDGNEDADVDFELSNRKLYVYVTAKKADPNLFAFAGILSWMNTQK